MTPRYDSLRKTARDEEIKEYCQEHPDYSHKEIAEHFGVSRSNVTRILGNSHKQVNKESKRK